MTPPSKKVDNKKLSSNKTVLGKPTRSKQDATDKATKPVASKAISGKVVVSKPAPSTKAITAKVVANKPATVPKATTSRPVSDNKNKTKVAEGKGNAGKSSDQTFRRGKKAKVPEVALVSKPVAQQMMKGLCELYPDADCELDYKSTFQLLISVILSAQTTDVQVNKCTPELFKRFPTAKALAEGSLDEIKELIKPTGFFNAKATNIQRCAQALVERFNGEVPKTLEELTTLPGAGRKTANVVLGVAFDVPGWTVDTHVQRLSARLGFTKETDPFKIELDLQNLFPDKDWTKYSITLIWHGRRLCFARNPDCQNCPINHLCPSSQV
ncbi:MAG: endonuclease III [Candidatus Melainabacteria bacterium]|nr:endonuclease III [Candidatus Melainabacteria bacterium]